MEPPRNETAPHAEPCSGAIPMPGLVPAHREQPGYACWANTKATKLALTHWSKNPRERNDPPEEGQQRGAADEHQKHLSVFGWNPGGKRKKENHIPAFIGGTFHVLLLQEAHGLITESIKNDFHIIEAGADSCLAVGLRKTTFREPAGEHEKLVTQTAGNKSWGLAMLVVRAEFLRPWRSHDAEAEVNHITVATLHLHNVAAKRPAIAASLLQCMVSTMKDDGVDILHGDFNMAAKLGYVREAHAKDDNLLAPHDDDALWAMPKEVGDCCGFLLRGTSFSHNAVLKKHCVWDYNPHVTLGIGPDDTGSHWPCFCHFRSAAASRQELRGEQGRIHREERAVGKRDRKKAKHVEKARPPVHNEPPGLQCLHGSAWPRWSRNGDRDRWHTGAGSADGWSSYGTAQPSGSAWWLSGHAAAGEAVPWESRQSREAGSEDRGGRWPASRSGWWSHA